METVPSFVSYYSLPGSSHCWGIGDVMSAELGASSYGQFACVNHVPSMLMTLPDDDL